MPVLLAQSQAPTLHDLLSQIPESRALVAGIESGQTYQSDVKLQGIGSLRSASDVELSFIVSGKYQSELQATQACAVIMPKPVQEAIGHKPPYVQILCEQPYLLYALVARWFDLKRRSPVVAGIHPSAIVDPLAQIAPTASIGAHVVIGAGTVVADAAIIHPNCSIGEHCVIGAQSVMYPNVTLYDHVQIGQRCILHSGAVLGADGFGFAPNPAAGPGAWGKIAQLGGVRLGDDVEVGANTTIDRGALDDTVIGNGVKLDNQIMIAHNCQVGDHTAMAACVGIAGSTTIGARCTIGGAAMLSGHLAIADDVHISGGTAITADISAPGRYTGVLPFSSHTDWQKNAAVIGQLSQLRKRLRHLERK